MHVGPCSKLSCRETEREKTIQLCNEGRRAGLGNGPNALTAARAVASPGMDTLPFVDFSF